MAQTRDPPPGSHTMARPPPVGRVLETALYVADLDRAEAFYRRLFGFAVLRRDSRMCALAVPGRQVLLLFRHGATATPAATPFGAVPAHDGRGVLHLCFAIAHADLDAWQDYLATHAVALESRVSWPSGGTSLYFRDPDGHSLEVATPGLWANDP